MPQRLLHRLHAWKSQHQYVGRYSVEKLCAFHHYQETTSAARVACVILATPLPPLLVLLAIDVVPMNDPRAGAAANGVAFARSVVAHALLPTMILLSAKQALQLSDRQFAVRHLARIGVCVSLLLELVCVGAAFVWRFPVPFREVTAIPLFVILVAFFNWYFGRVELTKKLPKLKHYLPMVAMQLSMYYTFLCVAVAYAYFSSTTQILLVLFFPFVKLLVKRAVWLRAQRLDDLSTDVTICFIELTGALYQTVCLQFAKSQALQYVILFADLFQALYEVRVYVAHEYITDGVSTVQTAVRIVLGGVFPGADERPLAAPSTLGNLRALMPSFFTSSGGGGSVFLKPKMIKASQTKRLLDLNQYKYEVDLPKDDDATHVPAKVPVDQPRGELDGAELPPTAAAEPGERSQRVCPVVSQRRASVDGSTVTSPRSMPSSAPSHYERHSKLTSASTYGISRAGTASASSHISSCAVSPAQEAAVAAKSWEVPVAHGGRPLRRTSSQLTSMTHSALRTDSQPSFSVFDLATAAAVATPLSPPRLGRGGSIMASLDAVTGEPKRTALPSPVKRSGSMKRNSKRGSVVHPGGLALSLLDQSGPPQETGSGETQPAAPQLVRVDSKAAASEAECVLTRAESAGVSDACDHATAARATRVMIDGIQIPRKDQARVLEQTLQLLFSCEVLLFVEYMEVLMPTLYGLVVGGLWPLHNARYNMLFIGMSRANMVATVSGSVGYAALESVSLLLMAYVTQKRYGVSAFHLLAFIIEKYWKVLYGKMIGSLLVIWLTLTVHQGVDFTFTYDYGVILERFASSRFRGDV